MIIEKVNSIGFCFGARRAIDIVERLALEHSGTETLGAVVHNQQVQQRLAELGVRVAKDVGDIQGDIVTTSAHGVSPQVEEAIRARYVNLIDTTCPFVHRAQIAARRLADSGFSVVIFGDADHPEVKGILGWTKGKGIATLDETFTATFNQPTRRLGILSQTTQIPAHFTAFVKKLMDSLFTKDSEMRIIDTICHDLRERQTAALELANRADLMLVIGSHTSANTNNLVDLCSRVTKTYLVETAAGIETSWFQDHYHIGITAGASTAEQTINEVLLKLQAIANSLE